ncbi:hypothetical protein FJZ26_05750, partial [Candidatus Parvarchaeota archaeon]|nr:hypothetical protein [Candidatus Parvarchaeota archaeon]
MPNEFQGIAFEVCNNPGMFGTAWQPWLVGVAFALIGSSVLVALIYMISTILKNPQFHAWAKFELYQIILTALISIGVVVTVSSICNVSPTLFADLPRYQGLTMFQAAENYLSWFRTSASIGFTYIFAVNNLLSRAIGVTWNMRP